MEPVYFEREVYHELIRLREKHNWHFRMRQQQNPSASSTNILLGSLNRWIGTSFWKIDHSMGGAKNDTIGLFFRQIQDGCKFAIDGRQLRRKQCQSQQDIAALCLVERMGIYPFDKFMMKEVDKSETANYTISFESRVFATVEDMMVDVEQFLSEFVPSVDGIIAQISSQLSEFEARRFNTKHTDIFERRLGLK